MNAAEYPDPEERTTNPDYFAYPIVDMFTTACAVVILLHLNSRMASVREIKILRSMLIIYIFMNIADSLCTLHDGGIIVMSNFGYAFITFCSMVPVVMGCSLWYQFINIRLYPNKKYSLRSMVLTFMPAGILCILNACSIFTGWILYITPEGSCELGPLFWIQVLITQTYIGIPVLKAVCAALRTASREKRKEYIGYVICISVAITGSFIEDNFPTIPLLSLCIFFVMQILFQTIYMDQQQKLAREEKELMESRMSIMLSQIQPHFLYNSLEYIQDMCHGKAPEAETATIEFAKFLRGNLDSLTLKNPITFRKELQHTQNYLALEINRFGNDKLHVAYDLKSLDFRIPALSLQPLVENAVRHGVMKKPAGGTVNISSGETKDAHFVKITDDGIGFDPDLPADNSRTHIGITNVRSRLESMCGGSLTVNSAPGKGTEATITIPKEWIGNEDTDR